MFHDHDRATGNQREIDKWHEIKDKYKPEDF